MKSSSSKHPKSAWALALIILLTSTLYSMERQNTPSDGSGSDEIPLGQLSLNENQEQQAPPAPNPAVQRAQQGTASGSRSPLQVISSSGTMPNSRTSTPAATTPNVRLRSIQLDGPEASPAPSPRIVTPSPRPDTPNTALSRVAENALRALDRGTITTEEALARIRQFLPPRSGRNSENRDPQSPVQNSAPNRE